MGKWSLLMVLGFSIVALSIMPRVTWRVNESFRNFVGYENGSQSHNIAVSAANMAANNVFITPAWRTGFPTTTYAGGTFSATCANMTGSDSAKVKIATMAIFQGDTEHCTVILEPGSFARFAYYSNNENGINWVTQDTVWGPMHTQDIMTINGKPTFWGKVTALKGTSPAKSTANFFGGYTSGVNIPLPETSTV